MWGNYYQSCWVSNSLQCAGSPSDSESMTGYIVSMYRMEESCANDGEQTEHNKYCPRVQTIVLVSFCMVFPLVLLRISATKGTAELSLSIYKK